MRDVKAIKAWKTTDELVFTDEGLANVHQQKLDLKARLADIVDQFYFPSMSLSQIVDALLDHEVDIRQALER